MKLLYIYEHSIKRRGDKYYHPYLDSILKGYEGFFTEITCITDIEEASDSDIDVDNLLNSTNRLFVPITKVTSIYDLMFSTKTNLNVIIEYIKSAEFIITKIPSEIGEMTVKIANKFNKILLVEMVGCIWDALWNHSIKGKIYAPYKFLKTRKSVKNAGNVIYVTQSFLQNRYPTKGLSIGCSDVKVNTVSKEQLDLKIKKIMNLKCTKTLKLATLAGLDVRYKGQHNVIKAISILKKQGYSFKYYLAGNGKGIFIKKMIKKYNLEDSVVILGSLNHAEVFSLLDQIDIYIQPSKQEGLPRALVEAMGRGCPAIASNIGGIPELLSSEFLFNPSSINDLAVKLKNMTCDKLAKAAQDNYNKSLDYSESFLEKKRLCFYEQILNLQSNVNTYK